LKRTSVSLLDRLQKPGAADADWQRMQEIYLPLISRWLVRVPGSRNEVSDLAQEVFVVLIREIRNFRWEREGSFRSWLRQIAVNRVRTHRNRQFRHSALEMAAANQFLDELIDPKGELARQWDREHDQHVFQKLLEIVQPNFEARTWQAFRRFAIDGVPAADAAIELNISENTVLKAKSRILKKLRQEAGHLLD
jgi:RNA polymerase sigma-70 factor (ECF subfamily)